MQTLTEVSESRIRELIGRGEFFWLDLESPAAVELDRLSELLGVEGHGLRRMLRVTDHPLLREYEGHVALVFFGAWPGGEPELVEVHIVVSGGWLVTVRRSPCPPLEELHSDLAGLPAGAEKSAIFRLLDVLAASLDDLVDPLEDRVGVLEAGAVGEPAVEGESELETAPAEERPGQSASELETAPAEERPGQSASELRREILALRSRLLRLWRIVRRQRDLVGRAVDEISDLPGLEPAHSHELRDVVDHMIRLSDRISDSRDRLTTALDLHNSTVANRLNMIMERLTIVATIFLPLTVITGFFGQNFAWMVDRLDSFAAFAALGLGSLVVSSVAVVLWIWWRLAREAAGGE